MRRIHGTYWTGPKAAVAARYLNSRLRTLAEILLLGSIRPGMMKRILPHLRGDEIVVDMGAGSGYMALPLAQWLTRGKVICLDLSMEMLWRLRNLARRKGLLDRVKPVVSDVCLAGLPDSCADFVLCVAVLHELVNPQAAANEIARILKPGGRAVVADFRPTWIGRPLACHGGHGALAPDEMRSLLALAGLLVETVAPLRHWAVAVTRAQ